MAPSRRIRSAKVRSDSDILVEGVGADYGWVSNYAAVGGTLGDWDPGGTRPSWWVGQDVFDGRPIGPHGPFGDYGRVNPPSQGGWWNTPVSDTATLLPAITRALSVIVNPIVRTEWAVETRSGEQSSVPLWVRDPMLFEPAPGDGTVPLVPAGNRLTGHSTWATVLTHAILYGRGAIAFIESSTGTPLPGSIHILNPYMITSKDGRWVLDPAGPSPLVTDFDGRFTMGGQTWRVTAVRGLPPNDGETPEGVLTRHFNTFRLGAALHKYADGVFTSGVPAGYLKVLSPNFDEEKANKLRADWIKRHGAGRRSIAVLNSTVDFVPISISPVDSDLSNLKRLSLLDVAHAFGLSAAFMDTGDGSMTYANITDRRRELVDTLLSAWGAQLMETLSSLLPYGTVMRVQWASFTSPDIIAQMPVMVQGVAAGLISPEEARALMGLPAVNAQQIPLPKPALVTQETQPQDQSGPQPITSQEAS